MDETTSTIASGLEVRPSSIAGLGLFAGTPIAAGARVVVWGGEVVAVWRKGCVAIAEDRYLAGSDASDRLNHSCAPNLWMEDEVTLVARREIVAGEELTIDYALFEADEQWVAAWRCRCGTQPCRRVVTGRDWRSPELQRRYSERFSPFLNERIRRLRGALAHGD